MAVIRVLVDSCGFDALALDDAIFAEADDAIRRGVLELVVTHVQMDELEAMPDRDKLRRLQHLTITATATHGSVVGVTRLGMARLTDDEAGAIYDDVAGPTRAHSRDALLLLTARGEQIPLLTDDMDLRKRCERHGVDCIDSDRLRSMIR